jgi:hypothetical protein
VLQLNLFQAVVVIGLADDTKVSGFFTGDSGFSFAISVGEGEFAEALACVERSYILKDSFGRFQAYFRLFSS